MLPGTPGKWCQVLGTTKAVLRSLRGTLARNLQGTSGTDHTIRRESTVGYFGRGGDSRMVFSTRRDLCFLLSFSQPSCWYFTPQSSLPSFFSLHPKLEGLSRLQS